MHTLICFGDSITAGWNGCEDTPRLTDRLKADLGWKRIINAGVSGDTTSGAIRRMDKDVLSHDFEKATILFGANDSSYHKGIPLDQFTDQLKCIVQAISPERCILLTPSPIIDERQTGKRTNSRIALYAEGVRRVASDRKVPLIDLHHAMRAYGDYTDKLLSDGLHFSDRGYDFLSGLITKKINELEKKG
ncbi:GDSL-type esterase/lipase family protein [Sporolactobacillus sp. Y61]|uniref:GDSL-type esterase/lipase family protein n=1 Tax=Sporolactobacillus sp. Y61 TaxID=3160863 RepID=A0AAU8IEY5_9BACL